MNTAQRIRICNLIEKMRKQKELTNCLGICDMSGFRHDKKNTKERRNC